MYNAQQPFIAADLLQKLKWIMLSIQYLLSTSSLGLGSRPVLLAFWQRPLKSILRALLPPILHTASVSNYIVTGSKARLTELSDESTELVIYLKTGTRGGAKNERLDYVGQAVGASDAKSSRTGWKQRVRNYNSTERQYLASSKPFKSLQGHQHFYLTAGPIARIDVESLTNQREQDSPFNKDQISLLVASMYQSKTDVPGLKHALEALFCIAGRTMAARWRRWADVRHELRQAACPQRVLDIIGPASLHLGGNCDFLAAKKRWRGVGK